MKFLELKIVPLGVVAIIALLMWLASVAAPSLAIDIFDTTVIGTVILFFGVMIIVQATFAVMLASTTMNPLEPQNASFLVTTGIYRFSRNPMYLGFLISLFAWAVWLSNVAAFLLLPVFVLYMNRFQIIPEERILLQKFGGEFEQYMKTVRRWI